MIIKWTHAEKATHFKVTLKAKSFFFYLYMNFRKGANRFLTIYKKDGVTLGSWTASFQLARNSRHQIMSLLQRLPLTSRERADLQPRTHKMSVSEGSWQRCSMFCLLLKFFPFSFRNIFFIYHILKIVVFGYSVFT